MWSCYLLHTTVDVPYATTYIGSTVDLDRRLRQHNGEMAGGARSTAVRKGEWEVAACVRGFLDQGSACSFEARWKRLARRKKGAAAKIEVARSLISLIGAMKNGEEDQELVVIISSIM
jgi:predicted GIY-YIG superfamily endonuclease